MILSKILWLIIQECLTYRTALLIRQSSDTVAQFTTRHPVATSMVFLAVILLGAVSFVRLPVNLLPDISFPRLLVWTAYRDVGPAEIEEFVTIPVEEAVATVAGVSRVHSLSCEGMSLVTVKTDD